LVDSAEIVNALVTLLRDIPDLVEAVGGDETRIYAYQDRYPKNVSLEMAKYQMPAPGIMVAYQSTVPGSFGGFEAWKHELSISLRAGEDSGDDTPSGYYRLFRLIVKGIPTGEEQAMQYLTVHPSCQPMDTPMMRRQTDAMGVDYFEISMLFTEIGDE
jgi:hypothetical protein